MSKIESLLVGASEGGIKWTLAVLAERIGMYDWQLLSPAERKEMLAAEVLAGLKEWREIEKEELDSA